MPKHDEPLCQLKTPSTNPEVIVCLLECSAQEYLAELLEIKGNEEDIPEIQLARALARMLRNHAEHLVDERLGVLQKENAAG